MVVTTIMGPDPGMSGRQARTLARPLTAVLMLVFVVAVGIRCDQDPHPSKALVLSGLWDMRDDGTICRIHLVGFRPSIVPIHYGLIPVLEPHNTAKQIFFRNIDDWVRGGCVGRFYKWALVWHCPECQKARDT